MIQFVLLPLRVCGYRLLRPIRVGRKLYENRYQCAASLLLWNFWFR